MCYFISVGLPASMQQKWIALLPQKMKALPSRYDAIPQKMKGFPVVTIVTAMCSCDLFNPCSAEESLKRYQRKGWSQSKIARAVENRKKIDSHINLHPDFRHWLADASEDAKESFLWIHWDLDRLDLESKSIILVEEFRREETHIPDEQLIHIQAPYQHDSRF